jgi:hypothetical protein
MGEPTWTEVKTVRVPERQGCVWTRALDWLTPSKLYRIEVRPRQVGVEGPVVVEGAVQAEAGVPPPPAAPGQPAVAVPPPPAAPVHPAAAVPPPPGPVQPGAGAEPAIEDQTWTPLGSNQACSADGDFGGLSRREALTVPGARLGTLIGKIGGSTGDQGLDPAVVSVFPIGRFCVFRSPDEPKTGPLYLSINDTPSGATQVEGSLQVVISEAL